MKLSLMILLLAAATSPAIHAERYGMQVGGSLLQMSVYDRDSHQQLPVYRHDGRYYVAGVPGHRYELNLQNRSAGDVLGIVSVDGVNAISGQTANWSQDDGYVLDGGSSYAVKGWRKSQAQVAGFVFADSGDSYASRTGRPDNVGVIGVAVFRSRVMPVIESDDVANADPETGGKPAAPTMAPSLAEIASAAPALADRSLKDARAAKTDAPLGTGFGQRERDEVHDVDFERASSEPDEVITLYYDTRAHLIARGVLPQASTWPRQPEAFPGRFVPDPPSGDSR
ncbi:hypothetical protein [Rhodanobacter sp. L36]|uniref:hypothetical protein n=1 Tax=Rhodanobacter sp. L36 TaxID=1747221 RepID=UPI00131E0686|nr:hypothetical protein [Rhodanobacter sp. L36]